MSFFFKNENFIKIKFHSEMRAMSLEEKVLHYNTHLKNETLKRLKEYFKKSTEELSNTSYNDAPANLFTSNNLELEKKTQDYIEIISLLKDYEFGTILYSIYFENISNQLFPILKNQLIENLPKDFDDSFLIIDFLKQNDFKNGDLSKSILIEKLNLTKNDFDEEKVNRNPIVKKLTEWISEKLIENNTESEIKLILFHYTKIWNLKYSSPYNEIKGIVLLNYMIASLKKYLPDLKIDFNRTLVELTSFFDFLFIQISLPPYLENENSLRTPKLGGYEIKKEEFNLLQKESCKYLINYEKQSISELFKIYFKSNETIQKLIFEIIKEKYSIGYIPNKFDIAFFNEIYLVESNDSQKLIDYFIRINYFFNKKNY